MKQQAKTCYGQIAFAAFTIAALIVLLYGILTYRAEKGEWKIEWLLLAVLFASVAYDYVLRIRAFYRQKKHSDEHGEPKR